MDHAVFELGQAGTARERHGCSGKLKTRGTWPCSHTQNQNSKANSCNFDSIYVIHKPHILPVLDMDRKASVL